MKNNFLDDQKWFSNMTGSGELGLFDDHVEIDIVPGSEQGFVEVTSRAERSIEGTSVEATLVVNRSDAGSVSISFDGTASDGALWTQLVPSETGSPIDFTVSLKAIGNQGEGVIDALLSDFSWQDCIEMVGRRRYSLATLRSARPKAPCPRGSARSRAPTLRSA